MQVYYGNYAFPDGGVKFAIGQVLRESQPGIPYSTIVTLDLSGQLEASTPAALALATLALRTACLTPFRDIRILHNGAVVEQMLNIATTTGVRCIDGPHFPGESPADFSSYRKFTARFEAEYIVDAGPQVYEYQQTVSLSGGEPVNIWQLAVNGPPKKVMTCPQTPYEAVQSGSAKGLRTWPNPPTPIFGTPDKVAITRSSPPRIGLTVRDFGITWEYRFTSVVPLNGGPGLPP